MTKNPYITMQYLNKYRNIIKHLQIKLCYNLNIPSDNIFQNLKSLCIKDTDPNLNYDVLFPNLEYQDFSQKLDKLNNFNSHFFDNYFGI